MTCSTDTESLGRTRNAIPDRVSEANISIFSVICWRSEIDCCPAVACSTEEGLWSAAYTCVVKSHNIMPKTTTDIFNMFACSLVLGLQICWRIDNFTYAIYILLICGHLYAISN